LFSSSSPLFSLSSSIMSRIVLSSIKKMLCHMKEVERNKDIIITYLNHSCLSSTLTFDSNIRLGPKLDHKVPPLHSV
jgi:hypothetical protein